ncbi:MAG: hypothetical protein GAK31_01441 [Stenotrophomonas maltophilia]|uniref:DUF998 domain-containing protein n=1 Tax=Stenotrophomonas maltophilia TaxID=40324 RepID=A0A7V8JM33_STEMA|nr:MAG: hypothetical protein GAK31_01441 [Stenotrophomonas maltophilia]
MSLPSRLPRLIGASAALLFVLAVAGFGAGLEGYSQVRHPVALLGAQGVPHALAFNLLGLVVPGLLALVVAELLRRQLPAGAGWAARVGSQVLLLAALAFALMGLLPLDIDDLDGPASQLHASAWMVWALGFIAGGVMLGVERLRAPGGRALGILALACAGAAAPGLRLLGAVAGGGPAAGAAPLRARRLPRPGRVRAAGSTSPGTRRGRRCPGSRRWPG